MIIFLLKFVKKESITKFETVSGDHLDQPCALAYSLLARPSSVDTGMCLRIETLMIPWASCSTASTLIADIF